MTLSPRRPEGVLQATSAGRRPRAFTTVEVLVSLILGSMLIGLVYAIFTPSQRQGQRLEREIQRTHSVVVLHAVLEQDVASAEEVLTDPGGLTLRSFVSRDPHVAGYGVLRTVRYAHQPGDRVLRELRLTPLPGSGKSESIEKAAVGGHRYGRVQFEKKQGLDLVAVHVQGLEPSGGLSQDLVTFAVHSPLVAPRSYWQANGFW